MAYAAQRQSVMLVSLSASKRATPPLLGSAASTAHLAGVSAVVARLLICASSSLVTDVADSLFCKIRVAGCAREAAIWVRFFFRFFASRSRRRSGWALQVDCSEVSIGKGVRVMCATP
eukprot:2416068-Prymnesium_polylepis.1